MHEIISALPDARFLAEGCVDDDAERMVSIGLNIELTWYFNTVTTTRNFSATFLLTKMMYHSLFFIPTVGLDVLWYS